MVANPEVIDPATVAPLFSIKVYVALIIASPYLVVGFPLRDNNFPDALKWMKGHTELYCSGAGSHQAKIEFNLASILAKVADRMEGRKVAFMLIKSRPLIDLQAA